MLGRGTLGAVWDGSGDLWGGLVRVREPSGKLGTGRWTVGVVWDG